MSDEFDPSSSFLHHLPLNEPQGTGETPSKRSILIKCIFNDATIDIKIFERTANGAGRSYSGAITNNELLATAKRLEIPLQSFLRQTRDALCTDNGHRDFTYSLDDCAFKWRKQRGGIIIDYGTLDLTVVDSSQPDFMEECVDMVKQLKAIWQANKVEIENARAERKEFLVDYKDCVDENLRIQDVLLNKFTMLINAKKRRIAELELLLQEKLVQQNFDSPDLAQELAALSDESEVEAIIAKTQKRFVPDSSQESLVVDNLPKRVRATTLNQEPVAGSSSAAAGVVLCDADSVFDQNTEELINDI